MFRSRSEETDFCSPYEHPRDQNSGQGVAENSVGASPGSRAALAALLPFD